LTSSFKVLLGGAPADAAFYNLVSSIEVEENADLPGAVQLTLPIATTGSTGSEDLTVVGDARFKPWARIAVVSTVDSTDACIFDGYVLQHKIHLDRGTTASTVHVWGQDASCLMNVEELARGWKQKDSEIAQTIFGKYSFSASGDNSDDDSSGHADTEHTVMQRATDAQFLRDRARRAGKLFRVACTNTAGSNTGYFMKPKTGDPAVTTLVLNASPASGGAPATPSNVDALDFEWDVARPTEVIGKALAKSKTSIDGGLADSGLRLLDSRSLATFADKASKVILTSPEDNQNDLQQRARSILREGGWFVKCEGETDVARLNYVLRAATVVQVNGAGRLHSGKYFVWSVRHSITAQSHRMKFVLVRNAVGSA
jgi:hypothetical protein